MSEHVRRPRRALSARTRGHPLAGAPALASSLQGYSHRLVYLEPVFVDVVWRRDPATLDVGVNGDLCLWSVGRLRPVRVEATDMAGGCDIRLHVAGMRFVDLPGISMLVELAERARSAGGSLALIDPRPVVRRLVSLCRLDAVLPMRPHADR